MAQVELKRQPSEFDRQKGRELFYAKPIIERGAPLFGEMLWVLHGRDNEAQHVKLLPDYCYHIFDVFRNTYFVGFPLLSETIQVTNQAALPAAKTIAEAKKVIRLDWKNLGRISGIALRCFRFAELEAEKEAATDGFGEVTPEETKRIFTVICGAHWVAENEVRINSQHPDKLLAELLNEFLASQLAKIQETKSQWDSLAYNWSPEAMKEYAEGLAEGMTSFLDEHRQLAGESERAGTYGFLLFLWPEIQAMQALRPRKTLTDLHEWLQPFMRTGLMTYLDLDTFRDVCSPPPQGIGLAIRPLRSVKPVSSD